MNTPHWRKDLLLVGGGHTHTLVLRMLAMRPLPGVRTTLVSLDDYTPYSGMLPGLIAGHYDFHQVHIDLRRYCARLGVRFITARALGLDSCRQEILLAGRPPLPFDALSLDIGSQPGLGQVSGAADFATPVKPIHSFYRRWLQAEQNLAAHSRIVLVGGGAGSVELALAMAYRLAGRAVDIVLICGRRLLDGYALSTRQRVLARCGRASIRVLQEDPVVRVSRGEVATAAGESLAFDQLFWCTSAVAEAWLADSGLACDGDGFLQVRDTLQLPGHDNIFAAGDVATQVSRPRPKAGVYAVRQAPCLAHNLSVHFTGAALRAYVPQQKFLSLLSLGEQTAVAERGRFRAHGAWVWRLKNAIDSRFMARFTDLPERMPQLAGEPQPMHCGGCGAKVPGGLLREVLQELGDRYPAAIAAGELTDDAAAVALPPGGVLWQSVDVLREFIDDPWQMGRIAVLHALSDLHAMGARSHSVLAHITLPYAAARMQSRDLYQIMAGALHELTREKARLIGGHTLEGPELSVGFTVNGVVEQATLRKNQIAEGDRLILCKALGTGVLLAAHQQGLARGGWTGAALDSMLQSNRLAADVALQQGVCAATDITGFGLLGHLSEMLRGTDLQACVRLNEVSLLEGVGLCYEAGIRSSLQAGNIENVRDCLASNLDFSAPELQPLFDPQTSGGLLLAVAEERADALLKRLLAAGYGDAANIGPVTSRARGAPAIEIHA